MSSARRVVTLDRAAVVVFLAAAACGSGEDVPDGVAVSFTLCPEDAGGWVAIQDGNLPWTSLEPTSGVTYDYTLTTGRGGIALVPESGAGVQVYYLTAAELNGFQCIAGSKTVNGTVASVPDGDEAQVSLGYSQAFVGAGASSPFSLTEVTDGALPLIAATATTGATVVNSIILRQGVNAPGNSALATLDFASAEAVSPTIGNFTLAGLGDGFLDHVASYYDGTQASTHALLSFTDVYDGGPGADPFAGVPLAQLAASDIHFLEGFAYDGDGYRMSGVFFRSATNRTITFGPALSPPVISTVTSTPYLRPQAQLASQAAYGGVVYCFFNQDTRGVFVWVSAGYLGGTPATWTVAMPDLSAAAGWDNAWGLEPGVAFSWQVSARGGADEFSGQPADGDVSQEAGAFQSPSSLRRSAKHSLTGTSRPEPRRRGIPQVNRLLQH